MGGAAAVLFCIVVAIVVAAIVIVGGGGKRYCPLAGAECWSLLFLWGLLFGCSLRVGSSTGQGVAERVVSNREGLPRVRRARNRSVLFLFFSCFVAVCERNRQCTLFVELFVARSDHPLKNEVAQT